MEEAEDMDPEFLQKCGLFEDDEKLVGNVNLEMKNVQREVRRVLTRIGNRLKIRNIAQCRPRIKTSWNLKDKH